jgi:hypothetical protein
MIWQRDERMPRAGRRRLAAAIALSAGFHVALLIVLAMQAPTLRARPEESAGPPEPIIPVLLMPKLPPSANRPAAPLRLHRRPQPYAAPPPIAPLPVLPLPPSRPAAPGPATVHPAPLPEGPKSDLRATLRGSPIGCATPELLTPAERDRCNETLGKGAKTAEFPGLGLSAEKQGDLDRAAQRKETCRAYKDAPGGMGAPPSLRNGVC